MGLWEPGNGGVFVSQFTLYSLTLSEINIETLCLNHCKKWRHSLGVLFISGLGKYWIPLSYFPFSISHCSCWALMSKRPLDWILILWNPGLGFINMVTEEVMKIVVASNITCYFWCCTIKECMKWCLPLAMFWICLGWLGLFELLGLSM